MKEAERFAQMVQVLESSGIRTVEWLPDDFEHPWPPGIRLEGGYRIERMLGRGGFAYVYEAVHPELGVVAVKVLDTALRDDPIAHARFVREGAMVAQVNHPNVLDVHHLGRTPQGVPFLVMELLVGEDLSALIARRQRVPVAAAVEIGIQLCGALEAMADVGVLHRDLKPHNVLLHREGGVVRPKLIDFGIATTTQDSLDNARRLTLTGIIVGTPHYLSPEQARGDELDIRSDLYSLGVLLYEAVCGRAPFEEGNLSMLVASVLRDERPPITDFFPECPPTFAAILDKTIRRDRDERFASPAELANALQWFAASEGLLQGDPALVSLQLETKITLPLELRPSPRAKKEIAATRRPPGLAPMLDAEMSQPNAGPGLGWPSNPPPALVARRPERGLSKRRRKMRLYGGVALFAALPIAGLLAVSVPERTLGRVEKASVAAWEGEPEADTEAVSPIETEAGREVEAEAEDAEADVGTVAAVGKTLEVSELEARAAAASEPRMAPRRLTRGRANARALERRAHQAYVRGRLARARTLYAQAAHSDPSLADAWRGYGLVAAQLGRSAEARWALSRYLRLESGGPEAAAVRAKLASLR